MSRRVMLIIGAAALLVAGCSAIRERAGSGPFMFSPESDAIYYVAVRDEALDAAVLWTVVYEDIQAATTSADFVSCSYGLTGASGAATPAAELASVERPGAPSTGDVASNGGTVTKTNVLERDGVVYSVDDRRDDRGIVEIDVRVERPDELYVTTAQLVPSVDDPHWSDPRFGPPENEYPASFLVVGADPDDSCLPEAESVRNHVQATGLLSLGGGDEEHLADFEGYRVLAVVWDGAPHVGDPVGGAFWWGGSLAEGVHPLNTDGVDTVGELPPSDEEPRPDPDWVDAAFLPGDLVRLDVGTYTVELWANPGGLTPSDDPYVPDDLAERHCTLEVEIEPGMRTIVSLEDLTDGGTCPHESEVRFGF